MTVEMDPVPWQTLSDAHARYEDAVRAVELADEFDRDAADAELVAARDELTRARACVAALGELLLLLALEQPGGPVQRLLAGAFDELAKAAWAKAKRAAARADWACARADALLQRVAELEARLADLTPGVGSPSLRVR